MGGGKTNLNNASLGKKKTIKGIVIGTILATILTGGLSVTAVTLTAKEIKYTPSNDNVTATNAKEALDELYELADTYKDKIKVEVQEKIVQSLYNNNMHVEEYGEVFHCWTYSHAFEDKRTDSAEGTMTIPIFNLPDGRKALMTSLTFNAIKDTFKNHAYDSASASLNYTVVTNKGKELKKDSSGTITINIVEVGIDDATEIIISGNGSVSADGGDYQQCRATADAGIKNVTATYILLD